MPYLKRIVIIILIVVLNSCGTARGVSWDRTVLEGMAVDARALEIGLIDKPTTVTASRNLGNLWCRFYSFFQTRRKLLIWLGCPASGYLQMNNRQIK